MSKFDEFFKFKVEEILQVSAQNGRGLILVQVVERMIQECPGGVQFHYTCRIHHEDSLGINYVKFNEIELKEYDSEVVNAEAEKIQKETYKAMARLRKMAREEVDKEGDSGDEENGTN